MRGSADDYDRETLEVPAELDEAAAEMGWGEGIPLEVALPRLRRTLGLSHPEGDMGSVSDRARRFREIAADELTPEQVRRIEWCVYLEGMLSQAMDDAGIGDLETLTVADMRLWELDRDRVPMLRAGMEACAAWRQWFEQGGAETTAGIRRGLAGADAGTGEDAEAAFCSVEEELRVPPSKPDRLTEEGL